MAFYACKESGNDRAAYNRAAKEVLDHIRVWKSLDGGWKMDWERIKQIESWIDYQTLTDIRAYAKMHNIQI